MMGSLRSNPVAAPTARCNTDPIPRCQYGPASGLSICLASVGSSSLLGMRTARILVTMMETLLRSFKLAAKAEPCRDSVVLSIAELHVINRANSSSVAEREMSR